MCERDEYLIDWLCQFYLYGSGRSPLPGFFLLFANAFYMGYLIVLFMDDSYEIIPVFIELGLVLLSAILVLNKRD